MISFKEIQLRNVNIVTVSKANRVSWKESGISSSEITDTEVVCIMFRVPPRDVDSSLDTVKFEKKRESMPKRHDPCPVNVKESDIHSNF